MICAIIGYGTMGKIRKNAIEKCGGVVISIYDEIKENRFNCNSIKDIIYNPHVNIVFICTPNNLNSELTKLCLENGKHVFCEKPPALNYNEILSVSETKQKFLNSKLMYGFNHRHHESVQQIKKIVDSKKLGNILWMRGRYGKNVDETFFNNNWRTKKELCGGGILIDQGIHMLDLFLYMAEDFDDVKSFLSNKFWKISGIEDNAFSMLRNTKKGIDASLHSTMTQWRHIFSFEIFLERGWMVLNGLKTSSGVYGDEILEIAENNKATNNLPIESHKYNVNKSWENEIDYFFNCIKNDIPIENGNINDALKIMKLIDEIYKEKDF